MTPNTEKKMRKEIEMDFKLNVMISIMTDGTILFMPDDDIGLLCSLVIDFLMDLVAWPAAVE